MTARDTLPVSDERRRIRAALAAWSGEALSAPEIARLIGMPRTKRLYNAINAAWAAGELRRTGRGRYQWAQRENTP